MKLHNSKLRSGFTLVELLTVVGIISILASLLIPAMSKAKTKAKSIQCVANLHQFAVGLRTFAEENEGLLPVAEQLPSAPADASNPLPRISDLLASQFGYDTNAMPQTISIFRCPQDDAKRFEENGSSYEWNSQYNGRPVENPRRSARPVSEAPLMYDYENFHPGGPVGSKNILFADSHVGKI
jgi:prepilin-type N-terminal cleavage/methylation domain-containing protein/prepilin-type processing-associated H-X9-DG protein